MFIVYDKTPYKSMYAYFNLATASYSGSQYIIIAWSYVTEPAVYL